MRCFENLGDGVSRALTPSADDDGDTISNVAEKNLSALGFDPLATAGLLRDYGLLAGADKAARLRLRESGRIRTGLYDAREAAPLSSRSPIALAAMRC